MKRNRKGQAGQVSPVVMLAALGGLGLLLGVKAVVKGVEKAGHAIARPFHHAKPAKK